MSASIALSIVAVSGCSAEFSIGGQSPEDAAVDLIEGELADQIGQPLTGACDDVDDPEVGTAFDCTGTTADGDVIDFVTLIDEEDHISVDSVNVVTAEAVGRFEAAAVEALGAETGVDLDPAAIDCGDGSVILPPSGDMSCTVTDPTDGTVYEATLTVNDLDTGDFDIQVGDPLT